MLVKIWITEHTSSPLVESGISIVITENSVEGILKNLSAI